MPKRIDILKSEIDQYFNNTPITVDNIELRNIACIADLVV